jgi:signal transduction histidine kinase
MMHKFWRPAAECLVAGMVLVSLTSVSYRLHFKLATTCLLYVIVVVLISRAGGFVSSIVAAIIAVLCMVVIAPPAFSYRIDEPLDGVAIIAFSVASLIIASLVSRVRKQAKDALSSVTYRVIEAEEQECRRIANELHEDIGQRLTLLALEIEKIKTDTSTAPVLSNRVGVALEQSLEILTDVKTLAHELYSPRLQYLGIAEVMSSFCSDFCKQNGVEIDFRGDGLPSLVTPDITLCLFRVLQEALHNALEHSGVRHFDGRLWGTPDEIHLTVSDSGVGFNLEAARNAGGLGLNRMQERLKLVRGALSIESQPEGGARIHARVPVGPQPRLTITENKRRSVAHRFSEE